MKTQSILPWCGETATLLATGLFSAPATVAMFRSGIPYTHDGQSHVLRFAAFALAAEHGELFPRWTAALGVGFGSPIFAFYAPGSYFSAEILHLFGLGILDSVRTTFALGIVLSALSMYLLGRELGGRAVGFAAGITYAVTPYQLHDVYVRGALAEAFALWLLPLSLYGFTRYARTSQTWSLGLGALSLAAVILAHNITALLFFPFLLLWIAGLMAMYGNRIEQAFRSWQKTLGRMALAIWLGVGLAAFFWLPAILEQSLVHIEWILANYNVHDYFNLVWPPMETSWLFDYRYDPIKLPVRPGLVQILLAIAGSLAIVISSARSQDARKRLWLLFGIPIALLLIFLQHKESVILWDHLPLITYLEFPYRVMALFGVVLALLTGFLPTLTSSRVGRVVIAGLVGCTVVVVGIARLAPTYTAGLPSDVGERGIFESEVARRNLAGATVSEYSPRWVTASIDDVLMGVTEPHPHQVPTTIVPATIDLVESGDTTSEMLVHARQPFRLVLHRLYMPGWHVTTNEHALRTTPEGQYGLLGVDLPAGDQRVILRYTWTGIEHAAALVSVGSAIGLITWTLFIPFGAARHGSRRFWPVVAVALAILAAIFFVVPRSSPTQPVQTFPSTSLAPGYVLSGVQIDKSQLALEGSIRVKAYIFAQMSGSDLLFRLRAVNERGQVLADQTMRPWNGPTSSWQVGELAPAMLDLPLPGGATAERIELAVTVFDASRPDIATGHLDLAPIDMPGTPPRPYHVLSDVYGNKLAIQGYDLSVPESSGVTNLEIGQPLTVTLDIQSTNWIGEDQTVFVHLLDSHGKLQAQHDALAGGKEFPTSLWLPGTIVRQPFTMRLSPDAPRGAYHLEVGFYELATMKRLAVRDALFRPAGDSRLFGAFEVGDNPVSHTPH